MMENKLMKAKLEVRRLWLLACEHDEIPPHEKFVVFSRNNPYDKPYNKAVDKVIKLSGSWV